MQRSLLYLAGLFFFSPIFAFSVEINESLKVEHNIIPLSSGFLHYRLQDQKLQLIFLNQKKVVIAPLASEGLVQVRFMNPRTQSDKTYTLPLVSQKAYLETIRPLKLPLNYRLLITLNMKHTGESLALPVIEFRPRDLELLSH